MAVISSLSFNPDTRCLNGKPNAKDFYKMVLLCLNVNLRMHAWIRTLAATTKRASAEGGIVKYVQVCCFLERP